MALKKGHGNKIKLRSGRANFGKENKEDEKRYKDRKCGLD